MKQRDERILCKMLVEMEYLAGVTDELALDAFERDETFKRAVSTSSINIGGLAKRLNDDFHGLLPHSSKSCGCRVFDSNIDVAPAKRPRLFDE